jgi:rare lipoprotein A (peptidoglycan hydrolase)
MKKLFGILIWPLFISCIGQQQFAAQESRETNSSGQTDLKEALIRQDNTEPRKASFTERGMASFTADEQQGQLTACGERYNMRELVAAHPLLPFGTIVKVTNLENGKSVQVRINDRGPYVKSRIIDVSFEAAKQLGFVEKGTTEVQIEVVDFPE